MSKKSNKYAGDQPAAYDPTGVASILAWDARLTLTKSRCVLR